MISCVAGPPPGKCFPGPREEAFKIDSGGRRVMPGADFSGLAGRGRSDRFE